MPKVLNQNTLGEFMEHNEAVVVWLKYEHNLMPMDFVAFHVKSLPLYFLNISLLREEGRGRETDRNINVSAASCAPRTGD